MIALDAVTTAYAFPTVIVSPAGEPELMPLKWQYRIPDQASAATGNGSFDTFEVFFSKLRHLPIAVDSDPMTQDEPPSANAVGIAQYFLQLMREDNLRPTEIVPSAEGGAAICFVAGNKYADIEFLNSGAILGVISDRRNRPIAWEIQPSSSGAKTAIRRIREFLNAS